MLAMDNNYPFDANRIALNFFPDDIRFLVPLGRRPP